VKSQSKKFDRDFAVEGGEKPTLEQRSAVGWWIHAAFTAAFHSSHAGAGRVALDFCL
jgi:hypothetical protein